LLFAFLPAFPPSFLPSCLHTDVFPVRTIHRPASSSNAIRLRSDAPSYAASACDTKHSYDNSPSHGQHAEESRRKMSLAINPFNPFGFPTPSAAQQAQYEHELLLAIVQAPGHWFQSAKNLIMTTRLDWTTGNPIIEHAWLTMTVAADTLLGLFVTIGVLQLMYGQSVGAIQMPVGQFLGKAVLTALLIHLSAFFGEMLLRINNALCSAVQGSAFQMAIQDFTNGKGFSTSQSILIDITLAILFGIGFIRVIFQVVKRIARLNLLHVFGGLAFCTSVHPSTSSIFSIWMRMYVTTIFEQFLQYLALGLGFQFVLATQQVTSTFGTLLAAAVLNLAAEIPGILSRISASPGSSGGGLGALASNALVVARLLA
jgi:hypothetical protein